MLGRQFFFFWQNPSVVGTRLYAAIDPVSGVDANGQFQSSTASAKSSGATFKTWTGAIADYESKGYTATAITILQKGGTTATGGVVIAHSGFDANDPLLLDAYSVGALGRAFVRGHHTYAFHVSSNVGVQWVKFGAGLELTTDETASGSTTSSIQGRYALNIGSVSRTLVGGLVASSRISGAAGVRVGSCNENNVRFSSASIQSSWNDGIQVQASAGSIGAVTVISSVIRCEGQGVHAADCIQVVSNLESMVLKDSTFWFNITASSSNSLAKQAITFKGKAFEIDNCRIGTENLTNCAHGYIALSVRRCNDLQIKRLRVDDCYEGIRIVTDASAANSGVHGTVIVDGCRVKQGPNVNNANRACFYIDEPFNQHPSTDTWEVRNNTFYGNSAAIISAQAAPAWSLRLENNLFVKAYNAGVGVNGRLIDVSPNVDITNDSNNNVYMDFTGEKSSGTFIRTSGSDHTTFGSHSASVTWDVDSFYVDRTAVFADVDNYDFRVTRHPLINSETGVDASLWQGGVSVSGSATYLSGTALSGSGSINIGAVGDAFVENRTMTGAGR